MGIDRFGTLVSQLPDCRTQELTVCTLRHAHNDLAQWSATLGIPGLFLIITGSYLLPASHFLRIIIGHRLTLPKGSASTVVLIVVYRAFRNHPIHVRACADHHAYADLVGLLLGMALRENPPVPGAASA